MLENSKIQTSVTRKVLSQHCTGVGRGKMCGEQNFPTLVAKVADVTRVKGKGGSILYLSARRLCFGVALFGTKDLTDFFVFCMSRMKNV